MSAGAQTPGEALRAQLCAELRGTLPPEALERLAAIPLRGQGATALALRLADVAARELPALALDARGASAAAQGLRALPPVRGEADARALMVGTEKVGRAHGAPGPLLRASGGAASTVLSLGRAAEVGAERTGAALRQLVFAVVRVVGLVVREAVPSARVAEVLGAALLESEPGFDRLTPNGSTRSD